MNFAKSVYKKSAALRALIRDLIEERGSVIDSKINERARIAEAFTRFAQGGKIGIVRSGMDCDCSRYVNARVIKVPGVFKFQIDERRHQEWLDGPEHTSICAPDELPESWSRDLALEAFEDGHPYAVNA